jgi:hypothetical protein
MFPMIWNANGDVINGRDLGKKKKRKMQLQPDSACHFTSSRRILNEGNGPGDVIMRREKKKEQKCNEIRTRYVTLVSSQYIARMAILTIKMKRKHFLPSFRVIRVTFHVLFFLIIFYVSSSMVAESDLSSYTNWFPDREPKK